MYQNLRLIRPGSINEAAKKFQCDEYERMYFSSADFEAPCYETKPIGEWKAPKGFPDCCPFHRSVFAEIVSLIERFPNCCKLHKKLNGEKWFDKKNYTVVPMKLLNTLSHTEYHILNRIDIPEWYKDITDYIEYCIASFGQLPDGYGAPVGLSIYLANVKQSIKVSKHVPKEKKAKLVTYIDNRFEKKESEEQTDLNILLSTYSKWLKTFPFELSFFSHLKERFKKQVPILKGELIENPYLGYSKAKLKTQSELISFLVSVTKKILFEINSLRLHKKGQLTDINKTSIELLSQARELELNEMVEKGIDERKQYRDILKQWLAGEERYLEKLKPLLLSQPAPLPQSKPTKAEKLKDELAQHGFFDLKMVKPLSDAGRVGLMELIATHQLPYQIAMFDYLGFIEHLEKEHFAAKYKLYKEMAKWLGSDKEGRAIKANISSLLKNSKENKQRYTAYLHKETVKSDYQKLK